MRIISKTKDYYDGVQSLGYDPDLCYVRKTEKEYGEYFYERLLREEVRFFENSPALSINSFIIGFCGEIYVCVQVMHNGEHYYCYSIDDMDKVIKKIGIKRIQKEYYGEYEKKYTRTLFNRNHLMSKFDDDLMNNPETYYFMNPSKKKYNKNSLKQIFITMKVPIFVIYKKYKNNKQTLLLNPLLKNYEFQKMKDPYTAYQEIAQYISGVLGVNSPETIDISDEDMRDKKGFDKWSFKKMPEK